MLSKSGLIRSAMSAQQPGRSILAPRRGGGGSVFTPGGITSPVETAVKFGGGPSGGGAISRPIAPSVGKAEVSRAFDEVAAATRGRGATNAAIPALPAPVQTPLSKIKDQKGKAKGVKEEAEQ